MQDVLLFFDAGKGDGGEVLGGKQLSLVDFGLYGEFVVVVVVVVAAVGDAAVKFVGVGVDVDELQKKL